MNNINKLYLLIFTLAHIGVAGATMYKGVDAEGNVIYSDKPFEEAERYTPPPISVMDADKAGSDEAVEEKLPADFEYLTFDIVQPTFEQTIRNETSINVVLRLKPGLNTEQDHRIWLLMDGKVVVEGSSSLSLLVEDVARGAHKLQAQVRNPEGEVVVRTRTTIVYLHRPIAR